MSIDDHVLHAMAGGWGGIFMLSLPLLVLTGSPSCFHSAMLRSGTVQINTHITHIRKHIVLTQLHDVCPQLGQTPQTDALAGGLRAL